MAGSAATHEIVRVERSGYEERWGAYPSGDRAREECAALELRKAHGRGVRYEVRPLPAADPCPRCEGDGWLPTFDALEGPQEVGCPVCAGTGWTDRYDPYLAAGPDNVGDGWLDVPCGCPAGDRLADLLESIATRDL